MVDITQTETWDIIPSDHSLDPLTVFWSDFNPGRGQITVTCYGQAWTAYFGGMGSDRTIRQFVAECSPEYLAGKLIPTKRQWLKITGLHNMERWLAKIVRAIQDELKSESESEVAS